MPQKWVEDSPLGGSEPPERTFRRLIMDPNSSRVSQYATGNRQAELVAIVERVLPRSLAQIETAALYLALCALWGLVFFTVLTNGL
jgi:hypothetical protein